VSSASLRVRLTPKAGRNEIVRREGDVLHVRVTAPPVDGAANKALIELLADALRIRKTAVRLKSGAASREKRLDIEGLDTEEMWRRLNPQTDTDEHGEAEPQPNDYPE